MVTICRATCSGGSRGVPGVPLNPPFAYCWLGFFWLSEQCLRLQYSTTHGYYCVESARNNLQVKKFVEMHASVPFLLTDFIINCYWDSAWASSKKCRAHAVFRLWNPPFLFLGSATDLNMSLWSNCKGHTCNLLPYYYGDSEWAVIAGTDTHSQLYRILRAAMSWGRI